MSVSCLGRVRDSGVSACALRGMTVLRSWVRDVSSLQRYGTLTPGLTNLGERKSPMANHRTLRVILGHAIPPLLLYTIYCIQSFSRRNEKVFSLR